MLYVVSEHGTIGEVLLAVGAVTAAQVAHVVELQAQGDKRLFGQIAAELGYLTEDDLIAYLSSIPKKRLRDQKPVG
jgi:hypothetical protein